MAFLFEFYLKDRLPVAEGSILKYLASNYDKDNQLVGHVFQLVGGPIHQEDNTEVTYTFSTKTDPYKTYIKVIN